MKEIDNTNDLVQITLMSEMKNLGKFLSQHEGGLLAYPRSCLMNAIRGEMRRIGRHAICEALPERVPSYNRGGAGSAQRG